MNKRALMVIIAACAILLILTACTKAPPADTAEQTEQTTPEQVEEQKQVALETFENEYCKNSVRNADLTLKSKEKTLAKIDGSIADAKTEIANAKKAGDQAKAVEYEEDLKNAEQTKQELAQGVTEAKAQYDDLVAKCTKLNKKADNAVCEEFIGEMQADIGNWQASLQKYQTDLTSVEKVMQDTIAQGKSQAHIDSVQKELDGLNKKVLTATNNLDKLNKMLAEMQEKCD